MKSVKPGVSQEGVTTSCPLLDPGFCFSVHGRPIEKNLLVNASFPDCGVTRYSKLVPAQSLKFIQNLLRFELVY